MAFEAKDLEQAELFRALDNVDSLSKELLRLAERAFVQAGLLGLDGSTVLLQEKGSEHRNAPRGHSGADPGGSPSPAASWEEEEEEHNEPREEQASDLMHAQEQVSAHASEQVNMPPLVITAS